MVKEDPTLMVRFTPWRVAGESMARLALHVHGDEPARAHREEVVREVSRLADREPLTMERLEAALSQFVGQFGLRARVTNARCVSDPLETIVDVSVYSASSGEPGR